MARIYLFLEPLLYLESIAGAIVSVSSIPSTVQGTYA